jgi:prepilin-type N-terminal cleavage/methylation domain-containing protein
MIRKAFTLIELLVVIAIIAILAAIMFPVFAQAKDAAKKTASLSNCKQTAISFAIYTTDSDDIFPLAMRCIQGAPNTLWGWNYNVSQPLGWMGPSFAQGQPARMAQDASHWSNGIAPYAKNVGIMEAPGLPLVNLYGYPDSGNPGQLAPPAHSNLTYNGLLHAWSATAIAAPSQLPLVWAGRGKGNTDGAALSNPALYCPLAGPTCMYNSGAVSQTGSPGPGSYMFTIYTTMWMYSKGGNVSFCDTSAKFRKFGATLKPGNTDYKTDPYTGYDVNGNPGYFWYDGFNAWLFRPDYTFN